jgi:hypothetical protein
MEKTKVGVIGGDLAADVRGDPFREFRVELQCVASGPLAMRENSLIQSREYIKPFVPA